MALEVTRVALVVRLLSLLLTVFTVSHLSLLAMLGQIGIGLIALWLLLSRIGDEVVARRPWLVIADTLLLAGVAVLSGAESSFLLTFMTSALLIGTWAPPLVGGVAVIGFLSLYVTVWVGAGDLSSTALAFPFCFIVLWWLGFAIQESARSEVRARAALQQAVTVAAASEERGRLARDLHDTLAKSLQALHLSAAALPQLQRREPIKAEDCVREIRELSVQAIEEARALMTQLRREPKGDSLPEMLLQLCLSWEDATGVTLVTEIDQSIEVTDELVRYELLMAMNEALENVRRHAEAHTVVVRLGGTAEDVTVTISDDGVGVTPQRLQEAEQDGHYGRCGMEERLAKVGGEATFDSEPGRGTTITLIAPRQGLVEAGRGAI